MKRFLMAVDNFYPNPDKLREMALRLPYTEPENYVGWRTEPFHPQGVKDRIEKFLRLPVLDWPDGLDNLDLGNGVFYIGLSAGKRAETVGVHYDTPTDWVTMIVYLTPGAPLDAGTSLWQHRATGLTAAPTRRDAARLNTPLADLEEMLLRDGQRPAKWREIDRVGNVYNRAAFYYSGMLHSATKHFGSNLQNGRVYQTFRFAVDWNAPRMK